MTETPGEHVCPRCALGRHQECTGAVHVDDTEQDESIWEVCDCRQRTPEIHDG
jgi:hypothetical protein